jgi:tetratricopeptide (TPR) repeat protein
MRRALGAYEAVLAESPREVRFRRAVALCNKYLASSVADRTSRGYDPGAALAGYQKSLVIEQGLLAEDPTNALFKRDLSHSLGGFGEALFGLGRPGEGVAAYERAIAIRGELAAADPKDMGIREALARAYANLGYNLAGSGNPRDALVRYRRAQPIFDHLFARDPSNAHIASSRALLDKNIGEAHAALGEWSEARQAFDRAVTTDERLKAEGRLPGSHEGILREGLEGRARCDAALAGKAPRNPKPPLNP